MEAVGPPLRQREQHPGAPRESPAPGGAAVRPPGSSGRSCRAPALSYGRVPVRGRTPRAAPGAAASHGPGSPTEEEQPPPHGMKAETTLSTLTPGGGAGHRRCLARRVPARAPPSAKGTAGTPQGVQVPPQTPVRARAVPPGPLHAQESISMVLRVPRKESSTPGTEVPSSAGLARRVPITKKMHSAVPPQRFFLTPHATPCNCQRRALQAGALSPQSPPSADTADSEEVAPSWDKVVVQLFTGHEGQQDAEVTEKVAVVAPPSDTPDSSKAQDSVTVQLSEENESRPGPGAVADPTRELPHGASVSSRTQRVALLLQQLLEVVTHDPPRAPPLLLELWGLMAEGSLGPVPPPPQDPCSLLRHL